MAFLQLNVMSKSLMRTVNVNVILPADKMAFPGMPEPKTENFKTLYLLHGVLGSQVDWVNGTRIQRWAEDKGLAVVMPAGENMFYVDQPKGHNYYGQFIGEELPELMEKMFRLSPRREDRYIAGLSMGGYGALRNGLKNSDRFSRIGAFSAALSIMNADERTNDAPEWLERRDYAEAIFGDLKKLKGSDCDPLQLMRQLAGEGSGTDDQIRADKNDGDTGEMESGRKSKAVAGTKGEIVKTGSKGGLEIPEIYMSCGTKDSLYAINTEYRDAFRNLGADVTWDEEPYAHEWDFWDHQVEKFLNWLPLEETAAGVSSGNVGI